MEDKSEGQPETELSREEMLKTYQTYRDDEKHVLLLEETEEMPDQIEHLCPACNKTNSFLPTHEPDLIDIDGECGHRYSISPKMAKEKLEGENSFSQKCFGCGQNREFKVDWQTRGRELEAWVIRPDNEAG